MKRSMADELTGLLLEYGVIVRLRAAVALLSTRGEAEAAQCKYERLIKRHIAARGRFVKRWSRSPA